MDWQGLFFSGTGFNSASHCASPPPAPSLPPFPCEEHGMVGFSLPNILAPPSPTTAPRPLLVPQDIPALLSYRWPSCLLLRFDCKSTRGCGEGGTETRGEEYTSRCFQGVQALWCLNFWSSPFPQESELPGAPIPPSLATSALRVPTQILPSRTLGGTYTVTMRPLAP